MLVSLVPLVVATRVAKLLVAINSSYNEEEEMNDDDDNETISISLF